MNRLPIAAALLLVLSGCAGTTFNSGLPILVKPQDAAIIGKSEGLPDIARGNQARLAGRFDDAERNLKPLAERGYPDAQVYLAATYSQMDRVDKNRDAIVWYRAALPTRPEIDISLARALINSGDRVAAIEAKGLILRARDERNDPSANSTLLFLYMTRPDFDVNKDAPALADKLSRSPLPADRIAAITWYREYIADDDHAERLFDLCKANLDIHLNCFIDLAHFYRYRNERPELDALVDYSLKVFAKGTPPPDPAVLYAVPEPVERLAGRLAAAMVEHVELADEVEFFETFKSQSQNDDGVDNDDAGVDESADLPEVQISPTPPPPDESASKASSAAIIEKSGSHSALDAQAAGRFSGERGDLRGSLSVLAARCRYRRPAEAGRRQWQSCSAVRTRRLLPGRAAHGPESSRGREELSGLPAVRFHPAWCQLPAWPSVCPQRTGQPPADEGASITI